MFDNVDLSELEDDHLDVYCPREFERFVKPLYIVFANGCKFDRLSVSVENATYGYYIAVADTNIKRYIPSDWAYLELDGGTYCIKGNKE